MPYKEKEIEKLYYGIREVAAMFQVNTSLLRFWEKEFDQLRPKKNAKGDRLYVAADIEQIKLIFHLVKEKGFTIQGAKEKLRHQKPTTDTDFEIAKSLQNVRQFLVDLKMQLEQ